jgi:hypothetical protein
MEFGPILSQKKAAPLAKLAQGESGVPATLVRFLPFLKHDVCFPPSRMPASIEISIKLSLTVFSEEGSSSSHEISNVSTHFSV